MALVTLASIYYPVHTDEHEMIIEYIEDKVEDWPKDNHIIIRQDSNTQGGIHESRDEEDIIKDKNIGLFGIIKKCDKGKVLLNLIHVKD